MEAPPFAALLPPHGQRRRPFPSIGPFWPSPRQSTKGGRQGNGRHVDHFIDQAPPRRRRRRLRDRQGGGRVRADGGSATASQAFFAGTIPRSRTPRGPCGTAPNAPPPRRAAGRMGRARGGAGRGRRAGADRRAPSSGPCWRARWPRRRTGRPCGRGASGRRAPPAGRRCRGSRARRRRVRIRPDSVDGFYAALGRPSSAGRLAPSSSAGPGRLSAERVPAPLRIAPMRSSRSGAAPSRAHAPRLHDAHGRRGRAFAPGRLNGAGESGRTRKGRRPAPAPPE